MDVIGKVVSIIFPTVSFLLAVGGFYIYLATVGYGSGKLEVQYLNIFLTIFGILPAFLRFWRRYHAAVVVSIIYFITIFIITIFSSQIFGVVTVKNMPSYINPIPLIRP